MAHVNRVQGPHAPATIRICSVGKGETIRIRTLSEPSGQHEAEILGYMCHWVQPPRSKGQSKPCMGKDCAYHKGDLTWYGFALAQRWDEDRRIWLGCIMQVTEHCELDMRGRYQRGQYWTLSRPELKRSGNPVVAELTGDCPLHELPAAFDFLPGLRIAFHMPDLHKPLTKNPTPARLTMEANAGTPPPGARARAEHDARSVLPPSAEELAKRKEDIARLAGRTAKVNGSN